LEVIECTNADSQVQKFTTEPLGMTYDTWTGSSFAVPRKARITVTQDKSGKTAQIIITQNPGGTSLTFHTTLYQFGRKDAFSGSSTGAPGTSAGGTTYANAIKNPNTFYTKSSSPYDWCSTTYNNGWSANTTTGDQDEAVVKTVYDPCPAGFCMPCRNAFTGFTTTGNNAVALSQFNVSGSFDKGWNFYTSSAKTSTIFFPAAGYRFAGNGTLRDVGSGGYSWSAVPYSSDDCHLLYFFSSYVGPLNLDGRRASGYSVRPVQE
jgi:hypothetical protein